MNEVLLARLRNLSEQELYNEVYCDPLTGCLNRKALESLGPSPIAIVDLDSLKYLNDTLGHRAGDEQLLKLAGALVKKFGHGHVYRLSGDEFLVSGPTSFELYSFLAQLQRKLGYFSFGAGSDLIIADQRLSADKLHREKVGLRAARGERPPWFNTLRGESNDPSSSYQSSFEGHLQEVR